MNNRRNYYRILHVQPDAPLEVIHSSYRTMMKALRVHPDLGGDDFNSALINEAYHVLSSPDRRVRYDAHLAEQLLHSGNTVPENFNEEQKSRMICAFCNTRHKPENSRDKTCMTCGSPIPDTKRITFTARQRQLLRVSKSDPVQYWDGWPQPPKPGQIIDLSPKGACFATREPFVRQNIIKIASPGWHGLLKVIRKQVINDRLQIGGEFIAVKFYLPTGNFLSKTI
ncbi:DnaJ domain-containing protein [Desulfotignum phosphitoxidans]|uniref:Riboflavin biosynthesis protein RibF n=1 Tax=Desulfotignum phosphitoxidans DSM 13687 TaxID=1286635 RepID=S0G509_9BACT|nr:DnaJ domain-containing protein [Desulfotignum phosphitoxidans]EMS80844.1 riboflavin biosynthesis protein RibF [Desulfotignum phosphitoxidans DSM 13687]